MECPYECTVEVLITDSEGIRSINKDARGIDAPTDVLSFPNTEMAPGDFSVFEEPENIFSFDPDSGELMLGDIVLNADRVLSQANEYGHSVERELAFLTVHSILHLTGYDHMTDDDERQMFSMQDVILNKLCITR
ncbi:MAG: rRNA maturation RNase YbeY [Lachnospiraceae bacterium]|nr:rRNA maturation RNase YbeY [Lachnospiraceae bacterium]